MAVRRVAGRGGGRDGWDRLASQQTKSYYDRRAGACAGGTDDAPEAHGPGMASTRAPRRLLNALAGSPDTADHHFLPDPRLASAAGAPQSNDWSPSWPDLCLPGPSPAPPIHAGGSSVTQQPPGSRGQRLQACGQGPRRRLGRRLR